MTAWEGQPLSPCSKPPLNSRLESRLTHSLSDLRPRQPLSLQPACLPPVRVRPGARRARDLADVDHPLIWSRVWYEPIPPNVVLSARLGADAPGLAATVGPLVVSEQELGRDRIPGSDLELHLRGDRIGDEQHQHRFNRRVTRETEPRAGSSRPACDLQGLHYRTRELPPSQSSLQPLIGAGNRRVER